MFSLRRYYTAAWCSMDPVRVAAHFAPNGSLAINGGTPAVGRNAITATAHVGQPRSLAWYLGASHLRRVGGRGRRRQASAANKGKEDLVNDLDDGGVGDRRLGHDQFMADKVHR